MSRALLVFAKTPVAGAVKTRLAGVLGAEGACELYTAFLKDRSDCLAALAREGGADIAIRWHVTPDTEPLRPFVGAGDLHEQSGASLGARMRAAFEAASSDGYESVVIIGTDAPTLGTDLILKAFDLLTAPGEAVLGPASDGGYYLLGLRDTDPGFLDTLTYSRPDVLERTVSILTAAGHRVHYLPELSDVDRPEDLERLQAQLEQDPALAPHTARCLTGATIQERRS